MRHREGALTGDDGHAWRHTVCHQSCCVQRNVFIGANRQWRNVKPRSGSRSSSADMPSSAHVQHGAIRMHPLCKGGEKGCGAGE